MIEQSRVLIIRHGATSWSEQNRVTGRTDLPLSRSGIHDCERLESVFREKALQPDLILTSPLSRAMTTAEILFPNGLIIPDKNLIEIDYGDYEGRVRQALDPVGRRWNYWTDGCPGGELPGDAARRAQTLLEGMSAHGNTVALVGHGQFSQAVAGLLLGLPQDRWAVLKSSSASTSIIDVYTIGEAVLVAWSVSLRTWDSLEARHE